MIAFEVNCNYNLTRMKQLKLSVLQK